jgi:predicted Zn finger-like uncharacterized protein
MITRCPRCATMFRVTPDQLKVRRGKVRCGKCLAVFNALETLDDEPQTVWGVQAAAKKRVAAAAAAKVAPAKVSPEVKPVPVAEKPLPEPSIAPDKLVFPALDLATQPAPVPAAALVPEPAPAPTAMPSPERLPEPVTEPPAEPPAEPPTEPTAEPQTEPPVEQPPLETPKKPTPATTRRPRRTEPSPEVAKALVSKQEPPWPAQPEPSLHEDEDELAGIPRRWPWLLGSLIATTILAVQAALYFRTELAVALPELKPALVASCHLIGCTVELPRKIDMIGIETSDLIFNKEKPGHLQLVATLRNRAPFAQVWPHLEVTLTDTGDRALLRRALAPAEYLPSQPPAANGIPARGEHTVQLDLQTTEIPAAGYRLYVFYP